MKKNYQFDVYKITVLIEPELVRIFSNKELWCFLNGGLQPNLSSLINKVKADYEIKFNKPLHISSSSLFVEIVTHIYFHNLGLKFNRLIKIKWLHNLVKKLIKRAEIIDCGETKIDGNRWFWDYLAKYEAFILKFLPKQLNTENFKLH